MRVGYILPVFPVLSETFILNELIELLAKGQEVYIKGNPLHLLLKIDFEKKMEGLGMKLVQRWEDVDHPKVEVWVKGKSGR